MSPLDSRHSGWIQPYLCSSVPWLGRSHETLWFQVHLCLIQTCLCSKCDVLPNKWMMASLEFPQNCTWHSWKRPNETICTCNTRNSSKCHIDRKTSCSLQLWEQFQLRNDYPTSYSLFPQISSEWSKTNMLEWKLKASKTQNCLYCYPSLWASCAADCAFLHKVSTVSKMYQVSRFKKIWKQAHRSFWRQGRQPYTLVPSLSLV